MDAHKLTAKELKHSEFILNDDGSIYHLALLPEEISDKIILVGDPGRVSTVSKQFDKILVRKEKREFISHTGTYRGKLLTVVSTGIGTDNIDIVLNELDALANLDFKKRRLKEQKTSLSFVRIGTCGSLQEDILPSHLVLSSKAIGLDSLMWFYDAPRHASSELLSKTFAESCLAGHQGPRPYVALNDTDLAQTFSDVMDATGITLTLPGFYGPQGRSLRLVPSYPNLLDHCRYFRSGLERLCNFEMETAGIYGLSRLLGHRAVSISLVVANRVTGAMCEDPEKGIEEAIEKVLNLF